MPTTLQRVAPSAVDDDPFWSTVVRERPDATYVLVPPAPPEVGPDPEESRVVVEVVGAVCRLVMPYVAATGSSDEPAVGWRGSPGSRRLVARIALVGGGSDRGLELAARIGADLGGRGWLLAVEVDREVATLHARPGDGGPRVRVTVSVGAGATVLDVIGTPGLSA